MRPSTLCGAATGGPRHRTPATRVAPLPNVSLAALAAGAAALMLGLAPLANAGERAGAGAPSGAVEREIARRQQQIEDAFRLVTEGDKLRAEGDLPGAIVNYRSAYSGMQPSAMSDEARAMALDRFASASVQHAEALIAGARYGEASAVLDAVLEPDFAPDHARSRKLRGRLRDPDYYNLALSPEHLEKVTAVEEALKNGRELFLLADFDKAEARYHDALRIDPTNSAARRGLEEVEARRVDYLRAARDQTRATMLREVDEAWESAVPLDDLDIRDASAGGVLSGISSDVASVEIERLLANTTLPVVDFEDTTLAEAVEFLTAKSKEFDPLGKGVNIVLSLDEEDSLARNALLSLKLIDIPLSEVLRYITRDTGTKFKVDRFAVTIVSEAAAGGQLFTRSYKVPPGFLNTAPGGSDEPEDPFAAGEADAGGGTNLRPISASAKDFLTGAGIPFPDGASAFYNAASSTLTVRNTQTNLDTIEEMIAATLREGPRQIVLAVKVVEVSESRAKELGLETLLGQFDLPGTDRIFGAGGTPGNTIAPFSGATVSNDFPFVPPGSDVPLGVNPMTAGNRSGTIAQPTDSIDGRLTNSAPPAVSTRAPGVFALAGPFTDPQFQTVLRALDQKTGVDVMTRPSTVAKSGQRATIQMTRELIYPTEYDPPEIPQSFGGGSAGIAGGGGGVGGGGLGITDPTGVQTFPVTPANPTAFETRAVGTTLEIEPVIGPDGYLIDLSVAVELVRFEGFLNYGSPITTGAVDPLGNPTTVVLTDNEILQPVFNTIRETTVPQIYDGSTLLIGGLVTDRLDETNDRTPLFGDLPILGRFFKTRTSRHERKVIMIFVSARIIDPSGRAVNVTGIR